MSSGRQNVYDSHTNDVLLSLLFVMPLHERTVLLQTLKLLFRPLVRFALLRSLKAQEMIEVLKTVFIDVAREELEKSGATISISRLSVMTGLQRRDVSRLLEAGETAPEERSTVLIKLVGQWRQDKRFSSARGPKPLSFEGRDAEFLELVRAVSKDVNPYAMLFELERSGIVEKRKGRVVLKSHSYVPKGDFLQGMQMAAADIEDLLFAVDENLGRRAEVPHVHIKTYYDNIAERFIPQIREWLLDESMKLHEKARQYLSQYDKDLNPRLHKEQGGQRVVLGTFSRTEQDRKGTADGEEE